MLYPTHLVACIPLIALTDFNSIALFIGCAIPDIIDKPLPRFNIVDTYHSVAHSAITLALFSITGLLSQFILSVAIGWFVHIIMDIIHMILNNRPEDSKFILWPIDFADDPMKKPPGDFFRHYVGTISFYLEFLIWIISFYFIIRIELVEEILSMI